MKQHVLIFERYYYVTTNLDGDSLVVIALEVLSGGAGFVAGNTV